MKKESNGDYEPTTGGQRWMREAFGGGSENKSKRLAEIVAGSYPYWNSVSLIVTGWLSGAIKFPFGA